MERFIIRFASVILPFGLLLPCVRTEEPSLKKAASAEKKKENSGDAAAKLKKRFYRSWLETETIYKGKSTKEPTALLGFRFNEDSYHAWLRRGELSFSYSNAPNTVKFDPTANPMRFDIRDYSTREVPDKKRVMTQLGICKFEGKNLVIVKTEWQWMEPPEKGKDYPLRPTEFKATKENGWTMSYLEPAEYGQQDD